MRIELSGRPRLAQEPRRVLPRVTGEQLERDEPAEALVPGEVDRAHPTLAQAANHLVVLNGSYVALSRGA